MCQQEQTEEVWSGAIRKGHHPSADLRYGEEDSIHHSTLIFAAIRG